jgi:hypothetical protein
VDASFVLYESCKLDSDLQEVRESNINLIIAFAQDSSSLLNMDELSIEPIAGEEAATISMSEVHLQQESRDADRRTCIRCV